MRKKDWHAPLLKRLDILLTESASPACSSGGGKHKPPKHWPPKHWPPKHWPPHR